MATDDIKEIVNLIVGVGIEAIVCGGINIIVPEAKGLTKICVAIASLAIVESLTDSTKKSTDEMVDICNSFYEKLKAISDKKETNNE